jgi:ubiquitin-like 1-activating enzyme E1 B
LSCSTNRLAARLRTGEETISFDKDDDDTLDFVTAASNLRSFAYGIDRKSRWEVKGLLISFCTYTVVNVTPEMAGNIIPAIATTNAIIAGIIVLQALQVLRKSWDKLRNVHIQLKPAVPISSVNMSVPNPVCGICRDVYTKVLCDPSRTKLGELVKGILGDSERDVSVFEDKRLLSDPDFDDNNEKTLESLNVSRGKFVAIVDEDGDLATITVAIGVLPSVLFLSNTFV